MKIILRKIESRSLFTLLEPVRVEPLELEYLEAALEGVPAEVVVEKRRFTARERGDIYVFTGYNTAYDRMRKEAQRIRRRQPDAVLIVGGVDAQVNTAAYEVAEFDYVFFTGALRPFRAFMEDLLRGEPSPMPGLSMRQGTRWIRGPREAQTVLETVQPNRSTFHRIRKRTRYLNYRDVALMRRRIGCPYGCGFCFCRLLNEGHSLARSFDALFEEMDALKAAAYWVVDDVFLTNDVEMEAFLKAAKRREKPHALIVYLRSEFILRQGHRLAELKAAGVVEVIVGFESIKSEVLSAYGKEVSGSGNHQVADLLKGSGISYTALFMVAPEDTAEDFKGLARFIASKGMPSATFSILTPLKGTGLYADYAHRIVEKRSSRFDFLHLVLPPTALSSFRFQWEFFKLHLVLLKSAPGVRTYFLKGGWIG